METQLRPLNEGQSLIYSRANIRRAFTEFDDTDISGLFRKGSDLVVCRTDGTSQEYAIRPIIDAFKGFTSRLPHFFSYLGPNFRGPSIWRNNCYILFKGWHYQSQGSTLLTSAVAQRRWANKFSMIHDETKLKSTLSAFDLGYLISPDGKTEINPKDILGSGLDETPETPEEPKPYCNCGSFQRQVQLLPELQEEIPGYQPTCKHMTWFAKYRSHLSQRSELIETCRGNMADNATAWYYAPPEIGQAHGRLSIIFTKHGQNAPLKYWRVYKSQERFDETHAWDLFDAMIEQGFVPFPHTALLSVSNAFKSCSQPSSQQSPTS